MSYHRIVNSIKLYCIITCQYILCCIIEYVVCLFMPYYIVLDYIIDIIMIFSHMIITYYYYC